MKKLVVYALLISGIFACGGEKKEDAEENKNVVKADLKHMETKTAEELDAGAKNLDRLIKDNMPNINKEQYIAAINTHYQFSQNFPEHKDAAYHLDKAQGYCQQIKDFARSEKMLAQLFREYPDYAGQKNGELYYLRATNLDYILGEGKNGAAYKREAKKVYQEFIEKFPDNPLVEDAKYRLENFDLTTDQIIAKGKK
ncbi:MAG: hypothetical protein KDC84_15780 [Crocinitomicaceae bacterium]|nr:hypothetical protein [Crocinitomicaceae bacterium]